MFYDVIVIGSWLSVAVLLVAIFLWRKKNRRRLCAVVIVLCLLFIYARFVEPQMLFVMDKGVDEGQIKVAVASDFHVGAYKHERFLERVVDRINDSEVDIVLIPGDFVFGMEESDLQGSFDALKGLEARAFAVLGNHDIVSSNGEFEEGVIKSELSKSVEMIDDRMVRLEMRGEKLMIIGVTDYWSIEEVDFEWIERALSERQEDERVILLSHNPDLAYDLVERGWGEEIEVMVSGHTHGGQIRVPFLYKRQIPTEHSFDKDWHDVGGLQVFVSAGLGETGLPMRFMVPPRIDLIGI